MSLLTAGKLAYLIPSQHFNFDTSVFKVIDQLKIICVGTTTGEILVYRYTSSANLLIIPKLILVPDPRQKTGAVRDVIVADCVHEEITASLRVTHSAPHTRSW